MPPLRAKRNIPGRAGEDTRPYEIRGTLRPFRRGRRPRRPAGGHIGPPLRVKQTALNNRDRSPHPPRYARHLSLSSLLLRDIIPTPFGLRPFPPDRGNRPLDKGSWPQGKARAGHRPAPTSNLKAVPFYCRGRSQTGPQMYAARRGRRALQPSTSRHLLSQARRSCGIASTSILGMSGPSGPAEI